MKKFLAAAAVLLASTVTAHAATFDFSYYGNSNYGTSFSYNVDGIGLTLTPSTFNQNTGNTNTDSNDRLGRWSNGIGVRNSGNDAHYVDGNGRNDMVIFSFDTEVTFKSVTLQRYGSDDDFAFYFDGTGDGDFNDGGDTRFNEVDPAGWNNPSIYNFAQDWIGLTFGVGAEGKHDGFKIKSITVEPHLSVVPLPAALPLYGAGVAILGFMGWRRKRKAS
ncbi:MAG: VPLPA-CTERM sorting domain-containing protein [Sneathiellales bacterium]|nr:VPLPA-CTERM sorting domain-containing protein [Sneathiellales bacterium]